MIREEPGAEMLHAVLKQFRLPLARAADPAIQAGARDVVTALAHFAPLLPPAERPVDTRELLEFAAGTNAFEPLRRERGLPVTLIFYPGIHPVY